MSLAAPPHGLLVVDDPADPGGFALLRIVADEAELLTVAVAPARRRGGIAGALLTEGLREAAARGAARVFLEVGTRNAAARALYDKHGFVKLSERRGYYGGASPDTALILARAL